METMIHAKLEFIDILKETVDISRRNLNLILFTFFASFPLFCFSVFFELCLQDTFFLASRFLEEIPQHENLSETDKAFAFKLIQLCMLYLFPYHLLDLVASTAIVDAASAVYTSEEQIGLRHLLRRSVQICGKFTGCLITSLHVLLSSTSALLGFIWVATEYYYFSGMYLFNRSYYYSFYIFGDPGLQFHLIITLFHGVVYIVLTAKYCKWSAGWHLGLVVSALEDQSVHGSEALDLSAYYSRGNERQGLWLMMAFFIHCLVLRMPCLFSKCSNKPIGFFYTSVYAGLICMGNAFKWVASIVYYYDCRSRVLEEEADNEIGKAAKPGAT